MNKQKIKEIVNKCLNEKCLCRSFFKYHKNYWYFIPLIANDKLFLSIEEDDFLIDGYHIRRFRDMEKAEVKDDLCCEILVKENIINSIQTPNIDISNWETIFNSLNVLNKNIIVEKESLDDDESEFVIGRIEKVFKHHSYVRHFDADGIWQDEPYKIPYTEITSLTFGSRYIEVFSKYVNTSYPLKESSERD